LTDLSDAETAAGLSRQDVADRPQGVRTAFAFENAAVRAKVLQQGAALHRTVTVSRSASGGTPRRPSSRRSFKINAMASDKLWRRFLGFALTIGPGDFWGIGHVPVTVPLENCLERTPKRI
jgi:hypothetical protein